MAKLPYIKTLESFDFSFQPSVEARVVRELATCMFIERTENVVFLGPPGTGKTHLSVALGLKAIQKRYRTLFTLAAALVAALPDKGTGTCLAVPRRAGFEAYARCEEYVKAPPDEAGLSL